VVAPLDALQLKVTLLLLVVGPGLLVEPGLVFVGVGGAAGTSSKSLTPSVSVVGEIERGGFSPSAPVLDTDWARL